MNDQNQSEIDQFIVELENSLTVLRKGLAKAETALMEARIATFNLQKKTLERLYWLEKKCHKTPEKPLTNDNPTSTIEQSQETKENQRDKEEKEYLKFWDHYHRPLDS